MERTELVGRISIILEEEDAGLSQVVVDGIRAEGFCQEELEGVLKSLMMCSVMYLEAQT